MSKIDPEDAWEFCAICDANRVARFNAICVSCIESQEDEEDIYEGYDQYQPVVGKVRS